jgi:hypothetical protein
VNVFRLHTWTSGRRSGLFGGHFVVDVARRGE